MMTARRSLFLLFCFLVIFCYLRFCYRCYYCCICIFFFYYYYYLAISETRRTCHGIPHRPLKPIVAGTRNSSEPALNPHDSTNEPCHFLAIHRIGDADRIATGTRRWYDSPGSRVAVMRPVLLCSC